MPSPDPFSPELRAGFHTWTVEDEPTRIVFVGKGPHRRRDEAFDAVVGHSHLRLSWPRQIHSAVALEARQAGPCGDADALTTGQRYTALSVATADCVPIVVSGRRRFGVIHAGWRGLAGQIIRSTLERLGEEPNELTAWIGPAIGACCYEVSRDVGQRVVEASDPSVLIDRSPRPHLDLTATATHQLRRHGLAGIHSLPWCTRCSGDWLWSYRRDHSAAGRNWTFAWRE